MKEVWKDIYFVDKGITYDYRGLYQISNLSRIKSLWKRNNNEEIILKPIKAKNGYLQVSLSKDKKKKVFYIHRLVAIHFIPNPNYKSEINHEDGDKENCKISNLSWVTHKENSDHAIKTGLKRVGKECPCSKKVIQYDKQGNYIKTWECVKDASKKLNINYTGIGDCCAGRHKTAGGYVWRYKDTK